MRSLAIALLGAVALLHFWFLVLEAFLWGKRARRILAGGFPIVQPMPAGAALRAPWMGLPR
jgi:hypothetical protein